MDDVTLVGSLSLTSTYNANFFDPSRDTDNELFCEIPDPFTQIDCPLTNMGVGSSRTGHLVGIYLENGERWHYRFRLDKDRGVIQCGSALLDKLFAPVLPAVAVSIIDFL